MNCGRTATIRKDNPFVRNLRSWGLKCRLSIVAVCLLASWGCSATEDEPEVPDFTQLPAKEDAVFGLSWSHSEQQLLASGVISGKPEEFFGKLGHMYSEVKMPRRFSDAEWYAIFFNEQGQMVRIACVGKPFKDDPSGESVRKRYEELKDVISRRIPIAGVFEDKAAYKRQADWWASIKDGSTHWATGFRGEVMEAVLEIRAESDRAGSYNLIVDHLQRMEELNRVEKQDDKSAF